MLDLKQSFLNGWKILINFPKALDSIPMIASPVLDRVEVTVVVLSLAAVSTRYRSG
jgi:hypothetical protein